MGAIGRLASRSSSTRLRTRLAGVEVSAPGMAILGSLARGGALRVSELAHRSGMVPTFVSREVGALESAGFVARSTDPEDRRAVLVSITDKGLDAYARLRAASVEAAGTALAHWSAEDLTTLATLLARMAEDFAAVRP